MTIPRRRSGVTGSLQEGVTITLLFPEDEEAFELSPAEKSLLLEAIAQADRGVSFLVDLSICFAP